MAVEHVGNNGVTANEMAELLSSIGIKLSILILHFEHATGEKYGPEDITDGND